MTDTPTPSTAVARTPAQGVQALVESLRPKMASILPRHLTAERMARVVLVEASRNPKLYECTPATLATCIMTTAQLGLEPSSPMGHAYLIPRWNGKTQTTECTLLLGYKGLCELARRSGEVARITAEVVYRDEMERGLWRASVEPPEIEHRWAPDVNRDEGNIVAAYARAVMRDGSVAQVVLTVADVERRHNRSTAKGASPWQTDYAAMARKSALRALLSGGLVPLSAEMATALDADADRPEPIQVEVTQPPTPTARDTRRGTAVAAVLDEEPADEPDRELGGEG